MESSCSSALKVKKQRKSLPVYIVEDHNEVLQYIYREIGSKYLPFSNGTIVHLDSHPDLLLPKALDPVKIHDKNYLFDILSIENWILPAVFAEHFTRVIWIKPPWAKQISEGTQKFFIGTNKNSGEISLSCQESYFISELLYSKEEDLEIKAEVTLTVLTLEPQEFIPHSLDSSALTNLTSSGSGKEFAISAHCTQIASEQSEEKNIVGGGDAFPTKMMQHSSCMTKDSSSRSMTSNPVLCRDRLQAKSLEDSTLSESCSRFEDLLIPNCPYVLDIDLDFYSTRNPFLNIFTEEQLTILRALYYFKAPGPSATPDDLIRASVLRKEQLNDLFFMLQHVKHGHLLDELPLTERRQQIENLLSTFKGEDIDFDLLHDAGSTFDDTELPHHVSSREEIDNLVERTKTFFLQLPRPGIITVSRSSQDDYCPPEDVDYIQSKVLKVLESIYGSLEVTKDYDDC